MSSIQRDKPRPDYTPDRTGSSIAIIVVLALIASGIAVLLGLSDKPNVDTIGIVAGPSSGASASPASATQADFEFADDTGDAEVAGGNNAAGADASVELDEAGFPIEDAIPIAEDDAFEEAPTAIPDPTATPVIVDAVQPTAVPDQTSDSTEAEVESAGPGLPTRTGSVQGSFFTRPDEDEGAVVAQNLITVSFAEDGSGAFQGVLDITYPDGTHILLNMSGPLVWTPTTPQVKATLAGAYTFDAEIDADDVTSDDAELSITSLRSGSGSLCTPKCFGFTFPPQ